LKVKWVELNDKKSTLIVGGKAGNNHPFQICRGVYGNQIIPGKYYSLDGCCYIGFSGIEVCSKDFTLMAYNN
jgi:hypothetical protein